MKLSERSPMTRRVLHYLDSDVLGGSEEAALHLMRSTACSGRVTRALLVDGHGENISVNARS